MASSNIKTVVCSTHTVSAEAVFTVMSCSGFPNMRCRLLDHYLCSELSTYDPEVAVVTGRVQKNAVASKAPVREEASSWQWDEINGRWSLLLRHTAEFHNQSLRPFVAPILRLLRFSQDVQWWHGSSALLRHVTGYVPKHAESWEDARLQGDDAFAAGLRVCSSWKPSRSRDLHDPGPRPHDDVKRSYGLHSSQMAGRE